MVQGVTQGFSRVLEIQGVGYKARSEGAQIVLTLGASHPIVYSVPAGVTVSIDPKQTTVTISGCDKELVGLVASSIRSKKPPEPYKGKGIRYSGEHIIRKAGKATAASGAGSAKK
jgi:large subunit ribosomal protein L6